MVDLTGQYQAIREAIGTEMEEVFRTAEFVNGSQVKRFSEALSEYLGIRHVIPCGNGTDALQIALMALGCEPGDEIITVPFTFVATVEVISLLRLKPVFVDIEPGTYNMDARQLKDKINPKTKAIIPVHLYGQCADMAAITDIAAARGIAVIEDNAQAIGCDYYFPGGATRKAGGIGDIGTTSFYPSKNLGAYGDGGALFTQSDTLAEKIRMICNHGSERKYYYDSIGVNSRLDSLQAAILGVKLRHLDSYVQKRREAAAHYDRALQNVPGIRIPERATYSGHVFHQYTIRVETRRDALKKFLEEKGIPSMIYYPVPLHLSHAYMRYGYAKGDFPQSEKAADSVLSLPMHTELDAEQLDYITGCVAEFMQQHVPVHG